MWDTVEFRSLRFLSWGGYAITIFGLILGFGSSFLLEPFYLPIVLCVFGVLLALVDRSEAKDETRISVDLRLFLISIKVKGTVQWQIPFDRVVAIQISYLCRPYKFADFTDNGHESVFEAYQVNLVFVDDSETLQRKILCDARTKWPSNRVASKLSELIGVPVVDDITKQVVEKGRNNTVIEHLINKRK